MHSRTQNSTLALAGLGLLGFSGIWGGDSLAAPRVKKMAPANSRSSKERGKRRVSRASRAANKK